jgi:hypothetical protein
MANRRNQRCTTTRIEDADLPATFRTKEHILIPPSSDCHQFLENDLSVKRVEDVLPHLWLVSRPYPARALNIQRVLNREIIPTTDSSLHLGWTTRKIYIKALPRYITSTSFYDQALGPSHPYGPALGLLFTYMALVPTELDFAIACESNLFHKGYEWQSWQVLTRRVMDDYPGNTIYAHLPKRYIHGELRLSRLDKIYRYRYGNWLHGYSPLLGNTRYDGFFADHLKFVTATTVYIALVLTAMQVGLAVEPLQSNGAFRKASYGFTVFAIFSPMIAVGFVLAIAAFILLANWANTNATRRRRSEDIGIETLSKSRKSKDESDNASP